MAKRSAPPRSEQESIAGLRIRVDLRADPFAVATAEYDAASLEELVRAREGLGCTPEINRRKLRAAMIACKAYADRGNVSQNGSPQREFPRAIARFLAIELEDSLMSNGLSRAFADLKSGKQGKRGLSLRDRICVSAAVRAASATKVAALVPYLNGLKAAEIPKRMGLGSDSQWREWKRLAEESARDLSKFIPHVSDSKRAVKILGDLDFAAAYWRARRNGWRNVRAKKSQRRAVRRKP